MIPPRPLHGRAGLVVTALAAALSMSLIACARAAGDWPQFNGPERTAIASAEGPALARALPESGPRILWTAAVGEGFAGAAARDGEVFLLDRIGAEKDVLRVLDLETGAETCRFEYDAPGRLSYAGSRNVPTVERDSIYTLGGFGHAYCFDRKSHAPRWTVNLAERYATEPPRWGWVQAPLVVHDQHDTGGERVLLAPLSEEVGLVALDAKSGDEVWRTPALGTSHSVPVLLELDGVRQVLFLCDRGDDEGLLASFDPATGRELWRYTEYSVRVPIPPALAIDRNRVFLTGGYRAGSRMLEVKRADDGAWSVRELFRLERGSQIPLPVRSGDHLYVVANENWNEQRSRRSEGGLMCLGLDGTEVWRTGDEPNLGRGSVIGAGNLLISQDGMTGALRLIEASPERFTLLAEAAIFDETTRGENLWSPLALADGRLLMRSQSELKCVDLRADSYASASGASATLPPSRRAR